VPGLIDAAAEALRADAHAFTRQNLFHAVRRAHAMSEARFEAALSRRLARASLPGLLPARSRRRTRALPASFPEAVLLVDRPAILDLFVACGATASERLAVVCIDGSPASVVAWLKAGFQAGRRAPVLYLHDAATVVYPFALEPLATLVQHPGAEPLVYADLGLPPLGATARRFGDPALPAGELILDLEVIPPATLVRYCTKAAARVVPAGLR
jgi:hypothetical protein